MAVQIRRLHRLFEEPAFRQRCRPPVPALFPVMLDDSHPTTFGIAPGRKRLVVVGVGKAVGQHRVEDVLAARILVERIVIVHPDDNAQVVGIGEGFMLGMRIVIQPVPRDLIDDDVIAVAVLLFFDDDFSPAVPLHEHVVVDVGANHIEPVLIGNVSQGLRCGIGADVVDRVAREGFRIGPASPLKSPKQFNLAADDVVPHDRLTSGPENADLFGGPLSPVVEVPRTFSFRTGIRAGPLSLFEVADVPLQKCVEIPGPAFLAFDGWAISLCRLVRARG
jgi:hypothetical protein